MPALRGYSDAVDIRSECPIASGYGPVNGFVRVAETRHVRAITPANSGTGFISGPRSALALLP